MLQQADQPTPEAQLAGPACDSIEVQQPSRGESLRTAVHGVTVLVRAFRGAAEPPPRPGLPDADVLAGMFPESRAALREKEWRSSASLIPGWYKLMLVSVGTLGATWGFTGSLQQALGCACAGSCLAWAASESYRRMRQLKLTQMNSQAPA